MSDIFSSFILVFAGLFPVVNPLGAAPIFLSLTADCTAEQRDRLAWNVAFNGFWLLFGSSRWFALRAGCWSRRWAGI